MDGPFTAGRLCLPNEPALFTSNSLKTGADRGTRTLEPTDYESGSLEGVSLIVLSGSGARWIARERILDGRGNGVRRTGIERGRGRVSLDGVEEVFQPVSALLHRHHSPTKSENARMRSAGGAPLSDAT